MKKYYFPKQELEQETHVFLTGADSFFSKRSISLSLPSRYP